MHLTCGVDLLSLFRHAARQVDRIFKGAKPSEMPFHHATKFAVVINLKTATTLGLTIPPTVLICADELIE
jgi:putative tryptophan/tyrosine transport system substrate-binding protein